jgi:hypothetical protein
MRVIQITKCALFRSRRAGGDPRCALDRSPPMTANTPLSRSIRLVRGFFAAALALVATSATPAAALSIVNLSVALGATNSADQFVDTTSPPVTRIRTSTVGVVSSTPLSFQTRYALAVGSDIGNTATIAEAHTANYTITLAVNQTAGLPWMLTLDTSRLGALTIVDDGNGGGTAALGAVTGSRTGAGTHTGSLGLAAVPTLTGTAGGNTPFSQTGSAVLTGVGTGANQNITLTFSFSASTTSTRQGNNGDEAAVRMGIAGNATSFTAGNYPGVGGRTMSSDGHFVTATLVPEPTTIVLMALGLSGLAMSGRRR